MIDSIFLLTSTGEVLIEKHFRRVLKREAVCQDFSAALAAEAGHPEDLPPILTTARHLLINVFEDDLFLQRQIDDSILKRNDTIKKIVWRLRRS